MPDLEDVRSLIHDRGPGRASVYLPTHPIGSATREDQIRLSNLLDDAERTLVEELGKSTARRGVAPARRLLKDEDFWLHQGRGLAVFLSADDGMRTYRLPMEVRERVVVSERHHVKPLLPLLSGDGRFYVLAVSQSRVRLFVASRDSVRQLDLHDVPESLRKSVGYDWEQKSLQFHAVGTRAGGAGGGLMAHGHGGGAQDNKKEVQQYFRAVDAGVRDMIGNRRGPVVLAMVDYLRPIYRLVSKLANILPDGIGGNPDKRTAEQLHREAWELVRPVFEASRREARVAYEGLSASRPDRTGSDLEQVLPDAVAGRVETLFVARDIEVWGQFDPAHSVTVRHELRQPGDSDLLDVAAAETLTRHGDIYALRQEEIPGRGLIAAMYRY